MFARDGVERLIRVFSVAPVNDDVVRRALAFAWSDFEDAEDCYHREYPMPLRKTAIAVSDDLLDAVDRAALSRGETRNRFVTRVLEAAVRARRDADVTRRLNELFTAPEVREAQRAETAALDDVGVAWDEDSW